MEFRRRLARKLTVTQVAHEETTTPKRVLHLPDPERKGEDSAKNLENDIQQKCKLLQ